LSNEGCRGRERNVGGSFSENNLRFRFTVLGKFFPYFAIAIFEPTNQNKPGRPGIGGFGLEIRYLGNDIIFKHGDSYVCHFN
jgi:hypothetical protein